MNQFMLTQGSSDELGLFPHIIEMGTTKNSSMRLNAFPVTAVPGIKFISILDGKFQWVIHNAEYTLYPGDIVVILPGQEFGSRGAVLEIGSFSWLHIEAGMQDADAVMLDKWSSLSAGEVTAISKIFLLNSPLVVSKFNDAAKILKCIQQELTSRELGHAARINNHIDELFILIARQLSRQNNPGRDFSKTFLQLEEILRRDLSHQWTVDEMAALVGLGTTLFNEKVKSYSGFTPLNYLINIRISEAIKLLKKKDISITDIALDTGFYSSQHFSTTFKKLTGFTPGEFRKNNSYNE
jgi:AraC-like DNA-binding protein